MYTLRFGFLFFFSHCFSHIDDFNLSQSKELFANFAATALFPPNFSAPGNQAFVDMRKTNYYHFRLHSKHMYNVNNNKTTFVMEISNCKTTKIALRTFATSIKNSLKSSSMHGDVILRSLNSLNAILLCRMCNELEKYGLHGVDLDVIRATFLSECYADLGSFLLQQLNVEWLRQLSEQKSEALFKSYFLCGSRHQGFAIMCHYIKDSRYKYVL